MDRMRDLLADRFPAAPVRKSLVAAVVAGLLLAGAALVGQERVEAGPHNGCSELHQGATNVNGYWARVVTAHCPGDPRHGGTVSVDFILDGNGNPIPADQARPAYSTRFNSNGSISLLSKYRGDPSARNTQNPPPRSPVNRDSDPDVRYQPNSRHRAVQDGGHCYREWRDRGSWRRSASYGTGAEACRRAAWNAYRKSQGFYLFDPRGWFPQEPPPGFLP